MHGGATGTDVDMATTDFEIMLFAKSGQEDLRWGSSDRIFYHRARKTDATIVAISGTGSHCTITQVGGQACHPDTCENVESRVRDPRNLLVVERTKSTANRGNGMRRVAGWRTEIISESENALGGFKEIVANISGKGVFARLKFESGVHRVQRIPVTESGGRC